MASTTKGYTYRTYALPNGMYAIVRTNPNAWGVVPGKPAGVAHQYTQFCVALYRSKPTHSRMPKGQAHTYCYTRTAPTMATLTAMATNGQW